MGQQDQSTKPKEKQQQPVRTYARGGLLFRWLYSRWRQVLAFLDLLGADGRPSATKMMAFSISFTVLFTVVYKTLTTDTVEIWTWETFWVLFLCCAVMFGRWGFDRFVMVMKEKQSMK